MALNREKKDFDGGLVYRTFVCFICVEGQIGGAEKSFLLLGELVKQRYSIIAVCPASSEVESRFVKMGIECQAIEQMPKGGGVIRKRWYFLKTSWRIWKIIKKIRPAIIHANNFKAGLAAIPASKLGGVKFVFHCRDMAGNCIAVRLCCWTADSVIAVSKAVRYWLIKKGCNKEKIDVVYNGVKTQKDATGEKFISKKICFGNVGQFVAWKRQGLFIEAAKIVCQQRSDVRFCIVGDDVFNREGKYKKELMQQLRNSPLGDCLELTGWQENMKDVWGQIDCLVHTAENEPFGRVVIEAMNNEIAVVAVDSGGCGEIVRDNVTGILVENADAVELADAMIKIAGNRYWAKMLGLAGRREVCEKFSFAMVGYKVMKIYERLNNGLCG